MLQLLYLLLQLPVPGQLKVLPALEVFQPGGEAAALHLDVGAVYGQYVVHAAVQEAAVVGDQDEAFFLLEVGGDKLPAPAVQMVGGLVDKQEVSGIKEQSGQQGLGPLPAGETGKGPLQDLILHLQQGELPLKFPVLPLGTHLGEQLPGGPACVLQGIGEVVEFN